MEKGSQHSRSLESFRPEVSVRLGDYKEYVGQKRLDEIKKLAEPLAGKRWTHLNSTFIGGGVSEMLRSVIPLALSLGIEAEWKAIKGTDDFFSVTKKFHNMLQGVDCPITLEEIFGAYLDTIGENAGKTFIASDVVVVHDPQPAALVMNGVIYGNILWRCHIDTSSPNRIIWRFLLPYINLCSGAIFTMPDFVGPGIQVPTYQIMPCIDPLAPKNRQHTEKEAEDILRPLFEKSKIHAERPVIAAISRYDIHKNQTTILKAFRDLKKSGKYDPPPYLIFLGNTATDDPEGEAMLETLKNEAQNDPDIHFWVNVEDNDRVVGALMRRADFFVHVSTKEGFGLVVAEAFWQGTPVIGSNVGGIPAQVVDSKNGFLVDALDTGRLQERMAWFLDHPEEARHMGEAGREHIRTHFLLPELFKKHLMLLRFYTHLDKKIPPFRLDKLAYSEVISALKIKHPYLKAASKARK